MIGRPYNVVLLVIDSLRAQSLADRGADAPRTAFFEQLSRETLSFRRAYATECWTLPSHLSMFTGRLPSEHRAHFQTMAYERREPTIAEVLGGLGYRTELVTRNFVFDGTITGVTRGFHACHRPLADFARTNLTGLFLALAKPRVRRHVRQTGFFHPRHASQHGFVRTFARTLLPADELALARVLDSMQTHRRNGHPYFVCCNLYDVHAPYAPQPHSLLRPWLSLEAIRENLSVPFDLATLGQHAYLRDDVRIPARTSTILRRRYHRAIELMDEKLAVFFAAARAGGLLEDTVVIVTSDHGEAFGEHGLYLHDASVYDTHLHVPLWIHHPDVTPVPVDDVVSTRDLFGVMLAAAGERRRLHTVLAAEYRRAHPMALAEHFFYPRLSARAHRYRQNLLAVITRDEKFAFSRDRAVRYTWARDRHEHDPAMTTVDECIEHLHRSGGSRDAIEWATAHLGSWQREFGRSPRMLTTRAA